MKKILFIFGTRPEALKLIPLIEVFRNSENFDTKVCITSQHREMLWQVLDFFRITPDYNLELMSDNQTLFDITAYGLKKIEQVLNAEQPDMIVVQGDTTSTFIGALSGFYKKMKVVHIEAGLRSFNKYSPFPEEINRKMVSSIADYHFCPTQDSAFNLKNEKISDGIYVVGNTVIDSLFLTLEKIKYLNFQLKFGDIDFNKRTILVTGHRRESFGKPFEEICRAISYIAGKYPNINFIYPVHLNPNVQSPVNAILGGLPNVYLLPPQNYPEFIWLMNQSYFILSDSGGVQEEAPSLGKPVLVMREVTERNEGIAAGTAKLIGTNYKNLVDNMELLLNSEEEYNRMANAVNPYGDGTSALQIYKIISESIQYEH